MALLIPMFVNFTYQIYVLDGCSASSSTKRDGWGGRAGGRADFDVEVVEAIPEWLIVGGVNREDDPLVGEVYVYILASSIIVSRSDVVSSAGVGDDIVLDSRSESGQIYENNSYSVPGGGGATESNQVAESIFIKRVDVRVAI